MTKLVVTARELKYAGKRMAKGDTFEAIPKDAKILKAIGKAKDAVAAAPSPQPQRRQPAGRTGRMQFPEETETGGLYNRRDMRAED